MMHRTWRRIGWALAVLGLGGLGARGDEPAAGQPAAGLEVNAGASRAYIKVTSSTRFGHDHGVVGRLGSGAVRLSGSGDLRFDMRSFIADRPEARRYVGLTAKVSASDAQKTTETMLGADVMDVARFPTARYAYGSATPLDGQAVGAPGRYRLDGEFTLHGQTRRLPLAAVVERTTTPGVYRMRCGFAIKQSDFGMTPYWALGGLVGVNDRLEIWGDLVLQPPAPKTATAGSAPTTPSRGR